MEYRLLGNTGMKAGVIGLGCEHLQGKSADAVRAVIDRAADYGVNLLDVFMSEPNIRNDIGTALKGSRDMFLVQGHIGSGWVDGQYKRVREVKDCEFFFNDLLTRLKTDYIDIGMLHFVDAKDDMSQILNGGLADYASKLKQDGVIRAIGMSSHDPGAAIMAVESGLIDVLMFSINPAYDLLDESTVIDDFFNPETYKKLAGELNGTRERLYRLCEERGVAITVMKCYGGGALLTDQGSPFGRAMSPAQCVSYCLSRPAVACVLPGCQTPQEVDKTMSYFEKTAQERDFSDILSQSALFSMRGRCVYCNHCLPCPQRIDIAAVNKLADLALHAGFAPESVKGHYLALEAKAGDCIECGVCEQNCPFGVKIAERMKQTAGLFGA